MNDSMDRKSIKFLTFKTEIRIIEEKLKDFSLIVKLSYVCKKKFIIGFQCVENPIKVRLK